jgi:hypothetical protein
MELQAGFHNSRSNSERLSKRPSRPKPKLLPNPLSTIQHPQNTGQSSTIIAFEPSILTGQSSASLVFEYIIQHPSLTGQPSTTIVFE